MLLALTPMVLMVARSLLGLQACFNRILVSAKGSNVVFAKTRVERAVIDLADAGNIAVATAVPLSVPSVSGVTDPAKVGETIVEPVTVDMVDILGPLAGYHAPDDAVRELRLVEDRALHVAVRADMSERGLSCELAVPHFGVGRGSMEATGVEPVFATFFPGQNAGFCVVIQQLIKNCAGKLGFSHGGLSYRSLWSGLAERWRALQARLFSPVCHNLSMVEV